MENIFDVTIIGAGPAGCACALKLRDSGLKVALIDKEKFPRDKPCGDAIPGKALFYIRSISPLFEEKLWAISQKEAVIGSRVFAPNGKSIDIHWTNRAFNCQRDVFDNALLQLVKENSNTSVFEGTAVRNLIPSDGFIEIETSHSENPIRSKFVVGADGANSIVAKRLTANRPDRDYLCAAIRGYYTGVGNIREGFTDIFLFRDFLPGYFWIFPVGDGICNVGFGILSSQLQRDNLQIKKIFTDIIESDRYLGKQFANARLEGVIKGHTLPLAPRDIPISGQRFILIGDAASLVDPLDGHGIDKGILSGILAAENIMGCFDVDDFRAVATKGYEEALRKEIWVEMEKNEKIMRFVSKHPALLNLAIGIAGNQFVKRFILKKIYG